MNNSDFTASIIVDQSPAAVFDAINDVRAWWSGEIEGDTAKWGDEFSYKVGDVHFSRQKVVEMVPDKRVVWLVTDSTLNFVSDKSEWTGTKIIFDITEQDHKTKLTFTHEGLAPEIECFNGCSTAWNGLIRQSLKSLITTGEGVKIF